MSTTRQPPKPCPQVFHPWRTEDGALVGIAVKFGDGRVRQTSRVPLEADVPSEVAQAIENTGMRPSRSHERVLNIMASPLDGLSGRRSQLRRAELDELLCAVSAAAQLPLDSRGWVP